MNKKEKTNIQLDTSSNDLVAYSRAGDVFHYRWAVRRCLKLIQPYSNLESIFVEASNETGKAGEYVIDVSEYYDITIGNKRIEYYQLKHTTVQHDIPFTLSGLKSTIIGFSNRFQQHLDEDTLSGVFFTIITNRKISESFKRNVNAIGIGGEIDKVFEQTIKKYTNLDGNELVKFCSLLNFEDSEGDYIVQKEDLRIEMARLQPGSIDSTQVDSIVSMVQEKVLPGSNGRINKEDILRPFGVTSEKQLFPAPALFDEPDKITVRTQYRSILDTINKTNHPVIIHAEGGVGKSVFSQYVVKTLSNGSLGIAYDCFGSGRYRSRSEPRHRHRDALVQIANELAAMGLCDRMLVQNTTQENDIMVGFLERIKSSIKTLKQTSVLAKLFVFIDAADNAEMAAKEFGDSCFAHELLREEYPQDCKIVLLCRPERIHLLKPPGNIIKLELPPFSKEETLINLRNWFPNVSESEGVEFHRLTAGNPRVQMNSLATGLSSVNDLLSYLGPSVITVEQQIEKQLNSAVQKIKDSLPDNYQNGILKICTGLASLPPNIPLEVLSLISNVQINDIKSFISDIGKALWLLDSSVQFIDEPTETWFHNKYLGNKGDFNNYIKILEPLAEKSIYVAEVLPQVYLQAGQYDKLIEIALSDEMSPLNNPIDTRNIRVYRLQFAFKAALRSENYKDAIKLALRAGEEVAGNQRQQDLFFNNIDLLPVLQNKLKIQEIAFKGFLKSSWEGSENVFTASLLSGIEEYKGEASVYLRSSLNWLKIYFEEKKDKENHNQDERNVSHDDIQEIAFVHLNLFGVKSCLKFLNSLKPKESVFRVMKRLAGRLIDAGRFKELDEILKYSRKSKYYVVAIVGELNRVGRFAAIEDIEKCLDSLLNPKTRIKKPRNPNHDEITSSVLAFLETCLNKKLVSEKIITALDYYAPNEATQSVGFTYDAKERILFLKALSIRKVISRDLTVNIDEIIPIAFSSKNKKRNYNNDKKEFKEVVGSLIPWFLLRAKVISGDYDNLMEIAVKANVDSKKAHSSRYKSYDTLPNEIADVSASILIYCNQEEKKVIIEYYGYYVETNNSLKISEHINLLRAGNRLSHLNPVLSSLESFTYELIQGSNDVDSEEIASNYISLARAVISNSKDEASAYFVEAINIVSKFGDELVERWEAVASVGEQSVEKATDKLAYRFIRCAELVGENVYKEKHWNRSRALAICANMSPQIGISTLSRWRDREIGRFEYQLKYLLYDLIKTKVIGVEVGWSLTRFLSDHYLNEFLSNCLENETSEKIRSHIFNDAYELLIKEDANPDYLHKLKCIADEYKINNESLKSVVAFQARNVKNSCKSSNNRFEEVRTQAEIKIWNNFFDGLDITTPEGFSVIIERISEESKKAQNRGSYWHQDEIFQEALNRIKLDEIHTFLEMLLTSETIEYYQCKRILYLIPEEWRNKLSFKKKWPDIIWRFGKKYSHELVNVYSFKYVVDEMGLNMSLIEALKKGVFNGLSQGMEFVDASMLFGFVKLASTFVNANEAKDSTDYALARFELHIEDDFGDGLWSTWLHVTSDINRNIAGFIWSALGSPRAKTRWNACHTIKKLADFNCANVLNHLMEWLEHDKVEAFGSNQLPFYNLHARQYLLIALNRISIDNTDILFRHRQLFLKYSQINPHVLIQRFSSEIALNIEKAIPGTYDSEEITILRGIGKSKQGRRDEKRDYRTDSYLHNSGKIETELDYTFGLDFEEYWYEPLGKVFGVSGNQVEDLCANVIMKDWGLGTESGYNNDPRVDLWNQSQDGEIRYRKNEYPRTDNLDFYLSYHSMLVVAAKLLENMPVVNIKDGWYDEEDSWGSWLSGHLLTREDGKWLADCRDSLPINRPEWINRDKNSNEVWRTDIQEIDFLKGIKEANGKEEWINVKGGWIEKDDYRSESFSVSSALVSKDTSNALLNALSTCSAPHDFKIPNYEETDMEINSGLFKLKGWIFKPYSNKGIDEFDPYAAYMDYPSFSIGESFLKEQDLTLDPKGKTWSTTDGQTILKCLSWSCIQVNEEETPEQSGMKLSATLSMLKKLCELNHCNLIIEVVISRDIEYRSRPEKYEYLKSKHKIYILSADGRLKSTEKSYRIR